MAWLVQMFFGKLFEYLGYIFYGLRFEGLENLEKCNLPVIFVSNHKSWIDHFIIIAGASRRKGMVPIHVLVADDIWQIPIVRTICRLLGAYPAHYGTGLEKSLEPLIKHLSAGNCVGLYPEGKIDRNHNAFGKPRPGAAWLALKTDRPILPMAIKGLEEFSWINLFLGRRKVTIKFDTPFKIAGNVESRPDIERGIHEIMERIKIIYEGIQVSTWYYAAQR